MNTPIDDARALLIESKEYLGSIIANNWSARREVFIKSTEPLNTPAHIVDNVRKVVCAYFGVTVSELCSRARPNQIAWPRQVAMYLCFKRGMFCTAIGHAFDRDHCTALHSKKSVEGRIVWNKKARADVEAVEKLLNPSV